MRLPIKLPFLKKKQKADYYLALILRDEKVEVIAFEQKSGKIVINTKYEEPLKTILENSSQEELVTSIDKAISRVEDKLPANVEIRNTVFGVKDAWVIDKGIKKEYLAKLKHLCEQLDLIPIGFIVLSEAIAHLIHQEEGAPLTALLAEIGKDFITISLFRAGKLIETTHKPITESPMVTVDEALKDFKNVEILPSRIILFHSVVPAEEHKKDELAQQFISHQWSKSLPFLHMPQISILPYWFDGKAIVAGAATQLGFNFSALPKDNEQADIKSYQTSEGTKSTEIQSPAKPELAERHTEMNSGTPDNFGFVMDKEIDTLSASPTQPHNDFHNEDKNVDKDEGYNKQLPTNVEKHIIKTNINEKITEEKQPDADNEYNDNKENRLSALTSKFSTLSFHGNKAILIIPPLILLLIISLILLYYFKEKAIVTLIVAPRTVNETQKINLLTGTENDFSQNIITAKEVTVELNGSSSTNATGQKEVGDKAKGTVTIYNSGTTPKTFKSGTALTSQNNLNYTMDKDISVASASGDIFSGIKSGTVQVPVTAKQIGTEYNLPSNTKFSIEGTNDAAAKNDTAFSGGSKKKITIIAKDDVDKLKEALPKSLEQKAKEQLQSKISSNEVLISGFTNKELKKDTLDKDIGDEAKSVTLTGTVIFGAVAYDKNDLIKFAESVLKTRYPNEQLPLNNIQVAISGLKPKDNDEFSAVAEITAELMPKIDTTSVTKTFAGKTFSQAQDYGKTLSKQVQDVKFTLNPNIPFLPQILPGRSENISIVIESSKK